MEPICSSFPRSETSRGSSRDPARRTQAHSQALSPAPDPRATPRVMGNASPSPCPCGERAQVTFIPLLNISRRGMFVVGAAHTYALQQSLCFGSILRW